MNLETIHNHDVVAERPGCSGDLRDEVLRDGRGGEHLTLDAWLALWA